MKNLDRRTILSGRRVCQILVKNTHIYCTTHKIELMTFEWSSDFISFDPKCHCQLVLINWQVFKTVNLWKTVKIITKIVYTSWHIVYISWKIVYTSWQTVYMIYISWQIIYTRWLIVHHSWQLVYTSRLVFYSLFH